MTKSFYMACLDVAGRRCVVVGGGAVGHEKAAGLVACGAAVTVVSPELDASFASLGVEWRRGRYRKSDLKGAFLVIAATSDRAVNERVHRDAEARGMLCNVADVPDLCNFILPAVHREGPIAVAVSTGGASPALAKRLRSQIAELVQPRHAELARELEALRPEVKERFETYEQRRDYFEELVSERLS
jgi:precorrin-2 dehydrogenase/sirohydrochlorin ferrochelatase